MEQAGLTPIFLYEHPNGPLGLFCTVGTGEVRIKRTPFPFSVDHCSARKSPLPPSPPGDPEQRSTSPEDIISTLFFFSSPAVRKLGLQGDRLPFFELSVVRDRSFFAPPPPSALPEQIKSRLSGPSLIVNNIRLFWCFFFPLFYEAGWYAGTLLAGFSPPSSFFPPFLPAGF